MISEIKEKDSKAIFVTLAFPMVGQIDQSVLGTPWIEEPCRWLWHAL